MKSFFKFLIIVLVVAAIAAVFIFPVTLQWFGSAALALMISTFGSLLLGYVLEIVAGLLGFLDAKMENIISKCILVIGIVATIILTFWFHQNLGW